MTATATATKTAPPSPSSATSSSTSSPTAAGTEASTPPAAAAPSACRAPDIGLSMESGSGAMMHIGYLLSAKNDTTSTTCTLQGYPGLSLVYGTAGQQLGQAAERTTAETPVVTLAPGQRATASVQLARSEAVPSCGATAAAGWRIYLPGETDAQFVPAALTGCSNAAVRFLEVEPFQVPTS